MTVVGSPIAVYSLHFSSIAHPIVTNCVEGSCAAQRHCCIPSYTGHKGALMASALSSTLAPVARCSALAMPAQRAVPAAPLQRQAGAAAASGRRAGAVPSQRSQVVARAVQTSLPPGTVLPLK